MRFLFLLFLVGSLLTSVSGQDGLFPVADLESRSLGGTGLSARGAAAVFTNPAGLAKMGQTLEAQATAEQRFGISELNLVNAAVAYRQGRGGFGLQLASFGFATYRETRVGLAYGRQLSEKFSIGGEITGFGSQTEAYAGSFDLTFGLGFQLEIVEELSVGARIFSPVRVERFEENYLPQLIAVGLNYTPNDLLEINLEAHQDSVYPLRVRAGIAYHPVEALAIRLGIVTGESEFSFGLGYRVAEHLEVGAAGSYHQQLGFSPVFGLVYR